MQKLNKFAALVTMVPGLLVFSLLGCSSASTPDTTSTTHSLLNPCPCAVPVVSTGENTYEHKNKQIKKDLPAVQIPTIKVINVPSSSLLNTLNTLVEQHYRREGPWFDAFHVVCHDTDLSGYPPITLHGTEYISMKDLLVGVCTQWDMFSEIAHGRVFLKRINDAGPQVPEQSAKVRLYKALSSGKGDILELKQNEDGMLSVMLSRPCLKQISALEGYQIYDLSLWKPEFTDIPSFFSELPLQYLHISDAAPLEDISGLKDSSLTSLIIAKSSVSDIRTLSTLKSLKWLSITGSPLKDIGPLRDLSISDLNLTCTLVKDLNPLKKMDMLSLDLGGTPVSDVHPLEGMSLVSLNIGGTKVRDIGPLQGMPLKWLNLNLTGVNDLESLEGMPLEELHIWRGDYAGLSSLNTIPLKTLYVRHMTHEIAKVAYAIESLNNVIIPAFGQGLPSYHDKEDLKSLLTHYESITNQR